MTKEVSVSREVGASAEQVWVMVSDLARMGEWSPEATGGEWLGGATGPAQGVRFKGHNTNGKKSWSTIALITECSPGQSFAFDVKAAGMKVATWRYDLEPTDTGCRVTETWFDTRSGFIVWMGGIVSGVKDRAAHNRANMEATLDALAASLR